MKPPWERRKPLPKVSPRRLQVLVRVIERTAGGVTRYRRSRSVIVRGKSYREVGAFLDQVFLPWTRATRLRRVK